MDGDDIADVLRLFSVLVDDGYVTDLMIAVLFITYINGVSR